MDQEPNEQDEEVFDAFIKEMEAFSRKLGLYVLSARGKRHSLDDHVLAGFEPIVRPIVVGTFSIGDEAFSDRVQHPENYTDEVTLTHIEHATKMSEAEEIVRRFRETGKIFEDDDDA